MNDERSPEIISRLKDARRLTAVAAVGSGLITLAPLPLLPELGLSALRSALLSRLARRRGIALPFRTALIIVEEVGAPPPRLTSGTALSGVLAFTRLSRALFVLASVEHMARTFLYGTYFDYYLVAHHQGSEILPSQAKKLREAIRQASAGAATDMASALFQRVFGQAMDLGLAIPRSLGRQIQDLLQRRDGALTEATLSEVSATGLLSRVVALVEEQVEGLDRAVLEALASGLDEALDLGSNERADIVQGA